MLRFTENADHINAHNYDINKNRSKTNRWRPTRTRLLIISNLQKSPTKPRSRSKIRWSVLQSGLYIYAKCRPSPLGPILSASIYLWLFQAECVTQYDIKLLAACRSEPRTPTPQNIPPHPSHDHPLYRSFPARPVAHDRLSDRSNRKNGGQRERERETNVSSLVLVHSQKNSLMHFLAFQCDDFSIPLAIQDRPRHYQHFFWSLLFAECTLGYCCSGPTWSVPLFLPLPVPLLVQPLGLGSGWRNA